MDVFSFAIVCVSVLVVHTLSDFALQTRWMGKNKSSSNKALIHHIGAYSFGMLLCSAPVIIILEATFSSFLVWLSVNSFLHGVTDYFSSRLSKMMYQQGREYEFWIVIGVDQLIHSITLIMTLAWMAS